MQKTNLITLPEWAEKQPNPDGGIGIHRSRAYVLASTGRLKGAFKAGPIWLVPENATYERRMPGRKAGSKNKDKGEHGEQRQALTAETDNSVQSGQSSIQQG